MTATHAIESVTTEDELFYMSNLFPKRTGLPFVVWVSTGTGAKHDVRVKVAPGPKANPSEFTIVGLRPEIHLIHGDLSPRDMELLKQWIVLNYDVILQYWDNEIDTGDLLERLKSI